MVNRREFLQASALAAGVAASLPMQAQPTGSKKPITSSVMLWTLKGSFEERMEVAAKSGVQSVELVGEHAGKTDAQLADMKKHARSLHLGMDTIIATPDWGRRPVSMVDPAQRDNFLKDIRESIAYAQKLEVPQIILMAGNNIPGRTYDEQFASLLEGTKRAGDLAAKVNVTLIVEPLNNKVDHKGYFLPTCTEGMRLIKETDHPHVKLLFDIYHEQLQQGNVTRTLRAAMPYVAVFHIADNPGRNDPGTGEMNYENIYKAIKQDNYSGYVTMEYLPKGDQTSSLTKAVKDMKAILA